MLRISTLSETGLVSADGAGALFLRSAGGNGAVPVAGRRAFPFPPIRSGISAPPLRHGRPDRPSVALLSSWPPCSRHGRPRPAISSAKPSFSALFAGSAVIFFRQTIIFGPFCWLDCCHGRPRPAISSAKPSFSALFAGSAVIFFRQAIIFSPFCRLGGQFLPSGHRIRLLLSAWWTANDLHM